MNVKELKKLLEDAPDHTDVMIEQTDTEFALSLLNSVEIKEATFQDGKMKAKDKILLLSDNV